MTWYVNFDLTSCHNYLPKHDFPLCGGIGFSKKSCHNAHFRVKNSLRRKPSASMTQRE